jgi:hypothetical protein
MKNLVKLVGIIALAAVIGFSMAACDNGSTGGGSTGSGGNKAAGLESEHFIISCEGFEENESTLIKLRDTLEGNYNRITTFLQVSLSDKSNFILYPDSSSFLRYLNAYYPGMNFGTSSAGTYFPNEDEVRMVTPGNNSLLTVAVHEFVHLVAQSVNSSYNVPSYLSEGVAVYLAGQNNGVQQTIASAIKNNTFPTSLNAMPGAPGVPASASVYEYGYAFVEYIVYKYNSAGLVNLYKNPNITGCFGGITESQFMSEWKAYCTTKYK